MIYLMRFLAIIMVLGIIACADNNGSSSHQSANALTIAFGSCNRANKDQPMWSEILRQEPDLWIWLGDNIYGDTDNMDTLKHKYQKQLSNPGYQNFRNNVEVIGTWDDHDYGINDGGKGYRQKVESQQLFLDFIGESTPSQRRSQRGIYTSYLKEAGDLRIKILLLDTRYHRDTVLTENRACLPNESGDILGQEQWQWLSHELKKNEGDVHIIASSIQVIPEEHAYEKWANFPKAKQRLFDLVVESKASGVFFLSGDRHMAEFSKADLPRLTYPIYDLTSSGLTHVRSKDAKEFNEYRLGPMITELNFGLLQIRKDRETTSVKAFVRGLNNAVYLQKAFQFINRQTGDS
ncbi:alkaline phosphatase D family protein [Fulvivirgaceae bacterium BMA12]|uniref:Alkaline phosphatase D family protein n=1 Tax=Agaribacillus aureus TaxID=3051825 RepID=A0ABT8LAG5_9BACT|nr:alkaline phosphatase D family protein [Fulvivirgaceae bacterium BMA12]